MAERSADGAQIGIERVDGAFSRNRDDTGQ